MAGAFVLLVEVRLHVAESQSLKSKRQVVRSIKDALRERLGAAVAEIEGQDTWQRATLLCALVGREEAELMRRGDHLEGIVSARAGEDVAFERTLRSLEDLRD
ncbi:MAG: DUF503 domain-containing protein [Solirubrobacterales bacterium]|nr:DUF503 domain-containing protein [Solirubrobacterales bacterium]MCB8970079.1 DUF503 domain-containing protein [Thermoleophilales bacterium]MCO5326911.1 DUF503 domain-containing protein [Solirubrobacterales bacterium]